jgi:hypothetical protein
MIKITCDKCGKEMEEENTCGYYQEYFDLCEDCEEKFKAVQNKILEFAYEERNKVEEKIRKNTLKEMENFQKGITSRMKKNKGDDEDEWL